VNVIETCWNRHDPNSHSDSWTVTDGNNLDQTVVHEFTECMIPACYPFTVVTKEPLNSGMQFI